MPALAQGGHNHLLSVGIDIGPTILRVAVLAAVPVIAGYVLLRGFLGEPDRRTTVAVIGAAGGAASFELLLSGGLGLPEQLVPLLLLGLAVPLYLILSTDPRFARAVGLGRAVAPWVFATVSVPALWWLGRAWLSGAAPAATATALHTGVVLALVALTWFVVARAKLALRVAGAVVASALVLATAQAIVVRPPDPVPGVAVVTQVDAGPAPVPVVVVPNRPGLNLVHVQASGASVGVSRTALAPARPMAGTAGEWATVRLPAGPSTVFVRHGSTVASFPTTTGGPGDTLSGLAGPDGPECASALLGEALAHVQSKLTDCPADALDPRDAAALRALARPRMTVVGDGSQRSIAAVAELRRAGVQITTEGDPVLVVAGWAGAEQALRDHPDAEVAPWLKPVTDQRYRTTLHTNFPGERPSAAGHRAWLDARGQQDKPPVNAAG